MRNFVSLVVLFAFASIAVSAPKPPQIALPKFAVSYNEGALKAKQADAFLVTFVGCEPTDLSSTRVVVAYCSNKDRFFEDGTVVISKWNKDSGVHEWLRVCTTQDARFVVDGLLNPKVASSSAVKSQICNTCPSGTCDSCQNCPNGQCSAPVQQQQRVFTFTRSAPVQRFYSIPSQNCQNGQCPAR